MTDKEKIRAEIERLKDIQSSPIALCNDLISFIDSLPEEPVSEDLEEAAKKAATWNSHIDGNKFFPNDYWLFKKGAQWQKEQMMKDAVYGLVCGHDENIPAWIDLNLLNKPQNVKVGDEVKLIIVKEAEK